MAFFDRIIFVACNRFLTDLKYSVDRLTDTSIVEATSNIENYINFQVQVESIRVRFRYDNRNSRTNSTSAVSSESLTILRNSLNNLIDDPRYEPMTSRGRFASLRRPSPDANRRDIDSVYLDYAPITTLSTSERVSIKTAMALLRDGLDAALGRPGSSLEENGLQSVKNLIPSQSIAPIKVEFSNNKLLLVRQRNTVKQEDSASIAAARAAISNQFREIFQNLQSSNCDKRIVDKFENIMSKFESDTHVVELGILHLEIDNLLRSVEPEINDTTNALIKSNSIATNMYLSQFSDWSKFVESAALNSIEIDDIPSIEAATKGLIGRMAEMPQEVDDNIPGTLRYISEIINQPGRAGKRAAFATIRSIENIIGKIYNVTIDFIEKTTDKTVESASRAVSRAVIIALLAAAINTATPLIPLTTKIGELQWLRTATEVLVKQMKNLSP